MLPIEARRTSLADQFLSHWDSFESFCGQLHPASALEHALTCSVVRDVECLLAGGRSTHNVRGWFLRGEAMDLAAVGNVE